MASGATEPALIAPALPDDAPLPGGQPFVRQQKPDHQQQQTDPERSEERQDGGAEDGDDDGGSDDEGHSDELNGTLDDGHGTSPFPEGSSCLNGTAPTVGSRATVSQHGLWWADALLSK